MRVSCKVHAGRIAHSDGLFFIMKEILKYISAKHFFRDYASGVTNFTHKMRGIDGNKKTIDFSEMDKKKIKAGVKQMAADISKQL